MRRGCSSMQLFRFLLLSPASLPQPISFLFQIGERIYHQGGEACKGQRVLFQVRRQVRCSPPAFFIPTSYYFPSTFPRGFGPSCLHASPPPGRDLVIIELQENQRISGRHETVGSTQGKAVQCSRCKKVGKTRNSCWHATGKPA